MKQTFQLLLTICLFVGAISAADDPFVGKWKLDPSKSTVTDEMKVKNVGENKYAFDFGSGNAEVIVTDGTDQPGNSGSTLAVSAVEPNEWRVIRKAEGHILLSAIWDLSEDGNTLTDHYTSYKSDASMSEVDYVYKRSEGRSGFSGTWDSTIGQMSAVEVQIEPYQGEGLSFISPGDGTTRSVKFDGKDYPVSGPKVLSATLASSGRRLNPRTIQLTNKSGGKVMNTEQFELSSDGKTLTVTTYRPSVSKPNVFVFDSE